LRKRNKGIVWFFNNDDFIWPILHDVTPQETSVSVYKITTFHISCYYVPTKQVIITIMDTTDRFLWCLKMLCSYKAVSFEITFGPLRLTDSGKQMSIRHSVHSVSSPW